MGGFLRALEKVGLVELETAGEGAGAELPSAAEVDALIARELASPSTAPAPAPGGELELVMAPPAEGDIVSRELEAIFAAANIPPSPYPAEKMLRLLDGLKAMDMPSRIVAVQAMDAADDAWTIDDALLDAQRKVAALNAEKQQILARAQQLVADNQQLALARDELQRTRVEALRAQIAELERSMAAEIEQAGADKAACQAAGEGARLAAQREQTRLEAEAQRFNTLLDMFGSKH